MTEDRRARNTDGRVEKSQERKRRVFSVKSTEWENVKRASPEPDSSSSDVDGVELFLLLHQKMGRNTFPRRHARFWKEISPIKFFFFNGCVPPESDVSDGGCVAIPS